MCPTSARPLAVVDIGNQQIKLGLNRIEPAVGRESPRLLRLSTQDTPLGELFTWLPIEPVDWCVATVHRDAEQRLASWVQAHRPGDAYQLVHNSDVPIEVDVEHPDRVGTDRLLAAVAANQLRTPSRNAIVIDAGSAITIDLVSNRGAFEGGVILPGLKILGQALANQTDALPLVHGSLSDEQPPVVGRSTQGAILSGMFWGSVGAVREVVQRITEGLPAAPDLFLSGGDAQHFAPFLEGQPRIVEDLVFSGLEIVHGRLKEGMPGRGDLDRS